MDLFTYLTARKGKKTYPHKSDLFSYLLATHKIPIKTETGTTIEITAKSTKLNKLDLDKESTQNGTPTPEEPIEVNTIKDEITISVSDGETTNNYTIDLGDNEICGIGDYKDILTINKNGEVSLTKKIGKIVLDGSESAWQMTSSSAPFELSITDMYRNNNLATIMSNYYIGVSYNSNWNTYNYLITCNSTANFTPVLKIKNIDMTTLEDFKNWLSTHNTDVYYVLDEPTTIDLGTIDIELFKGTNIITNNENADMTIKYY